MILVSITSGSLVAILWSFGLALIVHLNPTLTIVLIPRSVTRPVAIEISQGIGGYLL